MYFIIINHKSKSLLCSVTDLTPGQLGHARPDPGSGPPPLGKIIGITLDLINKQMGN